MLLNKTNPTLLPGQILLPETSMECGVLPCSGVPSQNLAGVCTAASRGSSPLADSSTRSEASLLASGCGEGHSSVGYRAPGKETRTASAQNPQLLLGLQQSTLADQLREGRPRVREQLAHNSLIRCHTC